MNRMALPHAPRVVITGAGSGFGRALSLALAPRGAHLLLSDVDEESAKRTAELASAKGARETRAVACDVTKVDDVERLAEVALTAFGTVDLAVNNAGVSSAGRIGEAPLADWRWTIETDLFGVIYGCHVFTPIFRKQGHGHMLNVASAAGLVHAPQMGAYNVAKAGVVALSETLAAELVGTNVGVTVLCPTFFRTDIAKSGRFADAKARRVAEGLVAEGKSAEEIARAAIRAVERGQLYSVPMLDGRALWRVKRMIPWAFSTLVGKVAARELDRR